MKSFFVICVLHLGIVHLKELSPQIRLQHNALPKSYNIKLQPSLTDATFEGEMTVFVDVQHSIKNISLNSKTLNISSVVLDSCVNSTGYELTTQHDLLNIFCKDQEYVDPGEHFIYILFRGFQTSESIGIFKSDIWSEGKRHISVATMFSASEARRAFPCFDEPDYKSSFRIRLIKPNDSYTALSNMEEIDSFPTEQGIAVDFQPTPPMSPYLVCFVITQYNHRSTVFTSKDGRKIPIRLFQLDEYLDEAPFLLEVARHALEYFEDYTNITYPISKLDFVEMNGFIFEGMENLGLVILTQNSISFNISKSNSKIRNQRYAAQLIVHEISHMWFGDIVTELWYNDLWLTEGFAQFMEVKGLDNQYPEWLLLEEEAIVRHTNIYNVDLSSIIDSPVVKFPETYQQVEDQFEDLIYSKGSAIVRMLEMVVGPENFKQCVREYMKKYYFRTSTSGDFISVLQKYVPNINMYSFLETWLYQNRYPMLKFQNTSLEEFHVVVQENCHTAPDHGSIFGHRWTIPVAYINSCNSSMHMVWFDRNADKLLIPKCNGEKWTKLNAGAMGFYRVLYTEEIYKQLLDNFDDLKEIDQANLIDETFHLLTNLQINCEIPLKLMEKMKGKETLIPVAATVQSFEQLLRDAKKNIILSKKLKNYFIEVFKELYVKLTAFPIQEDHISRLLRYELLRVMCGEIVRYEGCTQDIQAMFLKHNRTYADLHSIFSKISRNNLIPAEVIVNKSIDKPEENLIQSPLRSSRSTKTYIEICSSWIMKNL